MLKSTISFTLSFLLFIVISAQKTENIRPILLDKSVLSGVGLAKIDLKDEPGKDFYQKNLYWGKEIGVFVVSTENWVNKIEKYPFDEFVYMYHGEAVVKPEVGAAQVFSSGDYFFAPKGFKGEWEIRGGSNLHYELSVITKKRTDSLLVGDNPIHSLFKKSTLSGNGISLNEQGEYSEVLQKGAELTVKLYGEKPVEKELNPLATEKLLHILSGQILYTDSDGNETQYYTGDFIVFPQGCTGKWKSEGHGLVKYLVVEKSNN